MPAPFPHLAEPIRIGSRTARNRVMRLATVTNLGDATGVGERMLAHYRAVARGELGEHDATDLAGRLRGADHGHGARREQRLEVGGAECRHRWAQNTEEAGSDPLESKGRVAT